jgi:hypothetical protein
MIILNAQYAETKIFSLDRFLSLNKNKLTHYKLDLILKIVIIMIILCNMKSI